MNQQELEALLRQIAPNNDPGRLEFSEGTETVEVEEPGQYTGDAPVKKKKPVRTLTWIDRGTGQTLVVQADPATGTYTKVSQGVDPKMQGQPATTAAMQAAAAGASKKTPVEGRPGVFLVTTSKQQPDGSQAEETHYENEAGQTVPQPAPAGQIVPGTTAASAQYTGILNPTTGEIAWTDNPNAIPPKDQRWVFRRSGDGTVTREKNPYYEKPSKLVQDPSDPRKWIELTEDENGAPVIKPVTNQTTIKPADLPVLQTRFGEISQGLAALAQDLNRKYAAGEITVEERADAWKVAHGQADTQVAELNSILENSRAVWTGQINQRGQTLSETQSRRSFASDAAGRAIAAGNQVAQGALPGHGREIVAGVEALMNMQQRYAQGMGGFSSSPEIGLPPALEQARGIGLPGYPMPGAVAGPPGVPQAGPQMSGSGPPGVPPPPGTNAIGAGAIGAGPPPGAPPPPPPREYTPASATTGPLTGPDDPRLQGGPSPSGPPLVGPTDPRLQGMGAALGASAGFAGAPVAAGGAGMWDPMQAVQGMIGDGSDPLWAEAVKRAAAGFGRFRG